MGNTLVPIAASLFEVNDPVPLTRLRVITERPFVRPPETWYKGAGSPLQAALVELCDAQIPALRVG